MIGVLLVHSIGFIGYRNHAQRLIKIVNNHNNDFELVTIYHPSKNNENKLLNNDFKKLCDCDAVFIASPNDTHYEYIQKLIDGSTCKIFCEKPPCVSQDQIKFLNSLNKDEKERIFFNFNFRFSSINEILTNVIDTNKIGDIIHVKITSSHGLAFKNSYLNSWRSDGNNNLHNILETVSIHYVDLLNIHFGMICKWNYSPSNHSKNGTSFDSAHLSLEYVNGITCSIFNTYASSYLNEILVIGTNGTLLINDDSYTINFPRDSFDKNGLFTIPPIQEKNTFDSKEIFEKSLTNSVKFYLDHVMTKKPFDISNFESSLLTNSQILNFKN